MRDLSAWRRALPVALILALLVVTEAGLIAQNLGTAPQTNVAVQGQTGAQPEGTWLNLINWVGKCRPVGAGGAALAAIASFAAGRGFSRWAFTAMAYSWFRPYGLLEFWIQQGTGGISYRPLWRERRRLLTRRSLPPLELESYGDSATPQRPHQDDDATRSIGRGAMPDSGRH